MAPLIAMPFPAALARLFLTLINAALPVALIGLVAALGHARAHSWYPLSCCSEKDCFPVPIDDVRIVQGGWQLSDGTFIAHREARPSPDGQYHVCRHNDGKGALIRLSPHACFWAPMPGS